MEETFAIQIKEGIKLIDSLTTIARKPVDATARKQLRDSLKVLKKKYNAMKKDDNLRIQYIDRVTFDTIQGVFQAFHLYIISTEDNSMIEPVVEYLRTYENCYSIAERMQKAAEARADFNQVNKVNGR